MAIILVRELESSTLNNQIMVQSKVKNKEETPELSGGGIKLGTKISSESQTWLKYN